MRDGYQTLLDRRSSEDSFEFEGYGKFRSLGLTATAVKCIDTIKDSISVDRFVMKKALEFLKNHQNVTDRGTTNFGSFVENGSDDEFDVSLTASVAISMMENEFYKKSFNGVAKSAVSFLSQHLVDLKKDVDLSKAVYALSLARDEKAKKSVLDLLKKVKEFKSHEVVIEDNLAVASYTVLACLELDMTLESIPAMLWTAEKFNEHDWFDLKTHFAIITQAMAKFSQSFHSQNTSMNVSIIHSKEQVEMKVGKSEADASKSFKFPPNARAFTVNATGAGYATLDISTVYKVGIAKPNEAFALTVAVGRDQEDLLLTICTSLKNDEEFEEVAVEAVKGVVVEIELPKG